MNDDGVRALASAVILDVVADLTSAKDSTVWTAIKWLKSADYKYWATLAGFDTRPQKLTRRTMEVNEKVRAFHPLAIAMLGTDEAKTMPMKQCPKCGKTLEIDMFALKPGQNDGRDSCCKDCLARLQKQRRARGK